jgi:hypothetical protein
MIVSLTGYRDGFAGPDYRANRQKYDRKKNIIPDDPALTFRR